MTTRCKVVYLLSIAPPFPISNLRSEHAPIRCMAAIGRSDLISNVFRYRLSLLPNLQGPYCVSLNNGGKYPSRLMELTNAATLISLCFRNVSSRFVSFRLKQCISFRNYSRWYFLIFSKTDSSPSSPPSNCRLQSPSLLSKPTKFAEVIFILIKLIIIFIIILKMPPFHEQNPEFFLYYLHCHPSRSNISILHGP